MKELKLFLIFNVFTFLGMNYLPNGWSKEQSYFLPQGTNRENIGKEIEFLEQMEKGFQSIAKKVAPSVVMINVAKQMTVPELYFPFGPFGFFGREELKGQSPKQFEQVGMGSGFIIDIKKGLIVTNHHVVGGADEIIITTFDNKKYPALVLGTDANTDIAVLQVKDLPNELGQIFLTDSSKVEIGQWAIAVGAPLGLVQTVTRGSISAKGRGTLSITAHGDFIQTDAAINPGNSGGPLLNISGDAVGMNTAIFSRSGGGHGLGFAIPSHIIKDVVQKLVSFGKIERAYLGVYIQELTEDLAKAFDHKKTGGVLVTSVDPGGPAAKSGIQEGDIIAELNGKIINNPEQLSYQVSMSPLNRKVEVVIYRKGQRQAIEVNLQARDDEPKIIGRSKEIPSGEHEDNAWGMRLKDVYPEYNFKVKSGVLVVDIQARSLAEKGGVKEGDIILEINQKKVNNLKEFKKAIKGQEKLLLRVLRGVNYLYIQLKK